MKDLNRNVAMLCPQCGNDQFSMVGEEYIGVDDAPANARLRCSDCKAVYTKEEILAANAEKINIAAEEIVQEFEKELKKARKKWK